MCVCVRVCPCSCVCVCVRARARVCVCVVRGGGGVRTTASMHEMFSPALFIKFLGPLKCVCLYLNVMYHEDRSSMNNYFNLSR